MAEYIDKQKLMKNFGGYDLTKCQKYGNTSQKQRNMSYDTMMMYEIAEEIDCAPAADVAPVVHGQWTWENYDIPICSICGTYVSKQVYNAEDATPDYCPHCGAKMDGGNDYDR